MHMASKRSVFTTGQVATICCVAPRTVSRWVDEGLLLGNRLPGSRHRRIYREGLTQFVRMHAIPVGDHFSAPRVLMLTDDAMYAEPLMQHLPEQATVVASAFDAGCALVEERPYLAVIDCRHPSAAAIAMRLAQLDCKPASIMAIDATERMRVDWDERFMRPLDPELLVRRVETVLRAA